MIYPNIPLATSTSYRRSFFCAIFAFIVILSLLNLFSILDHRSTIASAFARFKGLRGSPSALFQSAFSPPPLTESQSIAERFMVTSRRRHPRDGFTFENVVDEPADSAWNQTFADMIGDYNNRWDCATEGEWGYFEEALRLFAALAKEAKVPWMLAYGTLLGYARDKYFTAYDSDVDVVVPGWSFELLQRYASVLPIDTDTLNSRGFLFLHPEFHQVGHTKRRDFWCNGTIETYYDGACGFTSPMGRFFYHRRYVDLYTADHYPDVLDDVVVYNEGYYAGITPARKHFPRRPCTFAGIEAYCPYDYAGVVRFLYGPQIQYLRPYRFCNATTKTQMTPAEAPELFSRKNKEWEERWGMTLNDSAPLTEEEERVGSEYKRVSGAEFCSQLNETQINIYMSSICRDLDV